MLDYFKRWLRWRSERPQVEDFWRLDDTFNDGRWWLALGEWQNHRPRRTRV